MRLIAIDPGYDKVGFAIFNKKSHKYGSDFEFVSSGLIKTTLKAPHEERLKQIYLELETTFELHKIEHLIIESLFVFKNQKTVMKVAQAVGVIELLAAQKKIPITHLTPLQIKESITGYGNADKQAVKKMIDITLSEKIKVKDDDESDAIACGLAFCLRSDFNSPPVSE
jgi:crossover junction endodeoxyribonuclease RuvC